MLYASMQGTLSLACSYDFVEKLGGRLPWGLGIQPCDEVEHMLRAHSFVWLGVNVERIQHKLGVCVKLFPHLYARHRWHHIRSCIEQDRACYAVVVGGSISLSGKKGYHPHEARKMYASSTGATLEPIPEHRKHKHAMCRLNPCPDGGPFHICNSRLPHTLFGRGKPYRAGALRPVGGGPQGQH